MFTILTSFFFSFSFGFVQINNFGVPKSANSISFKIAKILCETFSLFFFVSPFEIFDILFVSNLSNDWSGHNLNSKVEIMTFHFNASKINSLAQPNSKFFTFKLESS